MSGLMVWESIWSDNVGLDEAAAMLVLFWKT